MSRKRSRSQEAMTTNDTTTVSSVPLVIITDILLQLPIKSIVRFKCVSKSWLLLIKSSEFVTAHLNRSIRNHSLIVRYYNHAFGNDFGLTLLRSDLKQHQVELPPLEGLSTFPKIVGSCNGLLCLDVSSAFGMAFVLWNPATNEFKGLPTPSLTESRLKTFWMVSLGFGFNQDTNDYVLVRIVNFQARYDAIAEVYSTSTGKWKEVAAGTGSCVIYGGQDAVAVKGVLHWIANGIGVLVNEKFVVSYDMNLELFWRTAMPELPTDCYVKALSYDQSLALAVYPGLGFRSRLSNRFELWVMNEGKGWTRTFNTAFERIAWPVGSFRDSKIIMKSVDQFFLFNPKTKRNFILPIDSGMGYSYKVFTYVDSIVAVNGENDEKEVEAQIEGMVHDGSN